MLKESENPPIVWPEDTSIADLNGQWWVAHTKARNEKALAHDMIARQISYFLPMTWKVRRTRGRKIRSLLPVFGNYLFFCGNENDRLNVLKTNRVANIITVRDQQLLLEELLQIEKAIQSGQDLQPHPYIKTGQHCRVNSGALLGLEGIAVEIKGQTRLVLQVDMLGQATSVEVDADSIEITD